MIQLLLIAYYIKYFIIVMKNQTKTLDLGHSKLISCSTGSTDRNFRENKKIIILISSQNKK